MCAATAHASSSFSEHTVRQPSLLPGMAAFFVCLCLIFGPRSHAATDMSFLFIRPQYLLCAVVQRCIELFQPRSNILMYGRLGDAKLFGSLPYSRPILNQVLGQLDRALLG